MFNWIKRFNFGGGFRGSLNKNGLGFSWGIPGIRIGISPSGYKWIYITIPGTGIGFYKRFSKINRSRKFKSVKEKEISWKELK
ncbi:hypothetical protein CRV02_13150 [Arcobacter sp. CECT 8989]|uniref:DUF4236 domain-containing protein n=1 Tax=Arcobacter sp. CECT 8989 TaxID=2044509 RepID=UPI00100A9D6F|nr:DUF4236 domain-containing protein [Arcobacter sp. CECT 8989]RXJ98692.1 hypothetical protein CRV02_13150 [Arcobacter sp. CECT 8989]